MAYMFILLASSIHFYVFAMESFLWGRPRTNRTFGMSAEQAEHNRLFAFNQGYYNLFLAIGSLAGVILSGLGHPEIGFTLMFYSGASMTVAALVLFCSQRKLVRAALVQGLPPLLGLIFLATINSLSA